DKHCYVVLWMDKVHVWGHPLLLCMGATSEGCRHFRGFAEVPTRDLVPMQRLFQDHGLMRRKYNFFRRRSAL
ncbi:MAG: hypothetical protein OXE92_10060, partial [Bacteroidetes bacterium]|nr:hypothetical protein [Bacteroidota bacterium]